MDLDCALDDIIKNQKKGGREQQQKKSTPKNQRGSKKQSGNQKKNAGGSGRRNGKAKSASSNGNLGISASSKLISKAAAQRGANSNRPSRLARSKAKQQPKQNTTTAVDPASIVITKKVPRRNRKDTRASVSPQTMISGSSHSSGHAASVIHRGLSIRGASYGASSNSGAFGGSPMNTNMSGISIRGESGPTSVLISNLDPAANAEDIRMICTQFGKVTHCEVLVDRTGRSFGEAEVEFAQKSAALDCIRKLDSEVADGRIIRATLRSRPTMVSSSYMNQTVRSVIAPTRSGFTSA